MSDIVAKVAKAMVEAEYGKGAPFDLMDMQRARAAMRALADIEAEMTPDKVGDAAWPVRFRKQWRDAFDAALRGPKLKKDEVK